MRKEKKWAVILGLIVAELLTATGTILGNIAASQIPQALLPYIGLALPAFLVVTFLGLGLSVWQITRQKPRESLAVLPYKNAQEQENRRTLLKRMNWVREVLNHSLYRIKLDLNDEPEALPNYWQMSAEQREQSRQILPSGTHIMQIYERAEGKLLILGEPGSGKTTLLFELARTLLGRAERKSDLPMPVVFFLSSWAIKQQPLAEWLVEELISPKYLVPLRLANQWVQTSQILPLLDGLDEVPPMHRMACINAINVFRSEQNLVPVVVCCRRDIYFAQSGRLHLSRAVTIQPLTFQRVDQSFEQAGSSFVELRTALQRDQGLQKLTRTPLFVDILIRTYRNIPAAELPTALSGKVLSDRVLHDYIHTILKRRRSFDYSEQKAIHWLTWLARQPLQQEVFYLEQMQIDWLSSQRIHHFLLCFGVALVYGLAFGLIFGIDAGLVGDFLQGGKDGIVIGSVNFFLFLLLNGIFSPLIDRRTSQKTSGIMRFQDQKTQKLVMPWGNILYGLFCGSVNAFFMYIVDPRADFELNGALIAIAYAILGILSLRIQPVEVLQWSWNRTQRQFVKTCLVGILCALLNALVVLFLVMWLHLAFNSLALLLADLALGICIALGFAVAQGYEFRDISESDRLVPNQGIHISMHNGIKLGFVSSLTLGPAIVIISRVSYLPYIPTLNQEVGTLYGMVVAVFLVVWAKGGGLAWLYQTLLRLLLWQQGYVPWNYSRFLDYVAERFLLSKTGGGYSFAHRLIRDYFASQKNV